MEQKRTGYLIGLRKGANKETGKPYFIGFAALEEEQTSNVVGCGSDCVRLYLEEKDFNKLFNSFKLFQPIELVARVGTNKVYWGLAS